MKNMIKQISSFSRPVATGILASFMLCFASPASALLYDFSSPTGLLGNTQVYTVDGVSITAAGFTAVGVATPLFGHNAGGDKIGLGVAFGTGNEITSSYFVQFDMLNVWALSPTAISITFGSVVPPSTTWAIFGSNGGASGTQLYSGNTDFPTAFNLPSVPSGYRYLRITALTNEILVSSINAQLPLPEPGIMLLMGSSLATVAAFRKKNAKAENHIAS